MIDEEKLEQLLENDYGELYRELQFMPVDEFIAKNKEKLKAVPGFLDLYNVSSNAPHGLTEEQIDSYFDKESDKENYRKSEAEYNKKLEEQKKETEGFDPDKARRKKIVDEYTHSYLGMDKDNPANRALNFLADMVISPGTKQAIIEDEPTGQIIARGLSDVAAAGADALPGAGGLLVGPSIRAVNRVTNDDLGTALADIGLDYGGNVILGEGIRGLAGVQDLGPIGKWLEKLPFKKWAEIYRRSKRGTPNFPKETAAETVEEAVEQYAKLAPDAKDVVNQKYLTEIENVNPFEEGAKDKALKNAYNDYVDEVYEQTAKQNELNQVSKKWAESNKGKSAAGVALEGAMKTGEKAGARAANKYLRSGEDPKQKKYDSALDWIIKENERMWKAGFRPHAGIELEAWKKWKGIK